MNRLQRKCFIASAGVHVLLALILFIGPVFLPSPNSKADDFAILNFVPVKTVDEVVAPGGGNPNAKPVATAPAPQPKPQPAPTPAPPTPQPEPVKVREPEPVKEVQPAKPEEESADLSKERPSKKIEISTKLVDRRQANAEKKAREEAEAKAEARTQAKAAADARRRLARQIGLAAEHIGSELSGGTTVELAGPGGGGVPYANWKQAVKSDFANAWLLPDGVVDEEATTVASVTIGRDGTVISSTITKRSGDSVVDRSVQATLDRVQHTAPLPDTAKEDRRTVNINFNVRAKRALG